MMGLLGQDIRYGLRMLGRKPGLTVVALLTLALGIGANTSIFTLVNAVLLRPLPFEEADRLVVVHEVREGAQNTLSGHEYVAWSEQNRSFERAAMYEYGDFNLTGGGEPETVSALGVTADFFAVLRTRPAAGRALGAGDDRTGAPRVVVLSDRLWKRRYGSDPRVVGRVVQLSNVPYTVVGVMPPRGSLDPDVWVALDLPTEAQRVGRHTHFVVARLRAGVTIAQAQDDLARIAARLAQDRPETNTGHGVLVTALHDDIVRNARLPLLVFMGAVAFILLIACANVAHLLLTRAAARDRELAIRTALGASRGRLVRQLLTESLLLSLAGGLTGLLLAAWIIDLLPALALVQLPRMDELSIDARVLLITLALSLITGLVSGVVPALQSTRFRTQLRTWLTEGSRMTVGPGRRLAGALVVSEVALALMLLAGAGLTIRSFARLLAVDAGFDARNVLTVSVTLPDLRYTQPQHKANAYSQVFERMRTLPGVQYAGATSQLPVGPCCNRMGLTIEGRPPAQPGQEPGALMSVVTDDYFRALRVPLRSGRHFQAQDARLALPLIRWWPGQEYPAHFDQSQAPPVAIINEAMARLHWPGEDPLGKRFRVLFSPWVTVVGVVGNLRQRSLTLSPEPEFYLAHSQEPSGAMTVVLRTDGDLDRLIGLVRAQLRAFDPELPLAIGTMKDHVLTSVRAPRFNALLLGAAGGIALLLALIGIYGVMSYSVARRTHEIGIRSALGAGTGDVLRLIMGKAMVLAGAGIVLGLAGALALSSVLETMLFEVEPTDPLTFTLIALLLAGVAALASYLPTRRALRVDPLVALRVE